MNFGTELLEINSDNLAEAQFMASNFIDVSVQNRIFFNVIGSEAFISYLERLGSDVENLSSIHSIKRVVEKVDIADVILENIHIDVRVVFNNHEIFIPKSHFELGIVPDVYAVLKYDRSYQRINFIGYFEPSEIDLSVANDKYYFMDFEKLHSPFDMYGFIQNFKGRTDKNISDEQILKGRELSISVADHDVTEEEFKKYLSLLCQSSVLRSSVLEYDNFETLASKVARALQVSKSKRESESEVIDLDDFMNMSDDSSQGETPSQNSKQEESNNDNSDLNGDDLLDDMIDGAVTVAGAAAAGAAVVAGAGAAANVFGAEAASKEVMDLAGMAGEAVAGTAKDFADDDIDNLEDFIDDSSDNTQDQIPETSDETAEESQTVADEDEINDVNEQVIEEQAETESDVIEPETESESEETVIDEEDLSAFTDEQEEQETSDSVSDEVQSVSEEVETEPESEQENKTEDTEQTQENFDLDDFELKEGDLDFSDFEADMDLQMADDLITDEPTDVISETTEEKTEEDETADEEILAESEAHEEILAENDTAEEETNFEDFITEDNSEDKSEYDETSLEDLIAEENTEEQSETFEPEISEEPLEDFSEFVENDINEDNTVSAESEIPQESETSDDTENDDNASFDIGENLNISDTDDFSDIFDNSNTNDYDFGNADETPTEEIADDFDITDAPSEAVSDDTETPDAQQEQEDSLDEIPQNSEILPAEDITEEEEISDTDESQNESDNPFDESEDKQNTENDNPLATWDGEFTDVQEPDPEMGDDDLVFTTKEPETDLQETVSDLSELEDVSTADMGMELPAFVPPDTAVADTEEFDQAHNFDELPTEKIEEREPENDYGLVDFSDLTDVPTPEPYNAEVNFADAEDFANFETIAPIDENADVDYFADSYEMEELLNSNTVKENSVVISDKNHTPGEIFIDINRDASAVGIPPANEHLEELYSRDNNVIPDDNGLNNGVRINSEKGKTIPIVLGIGGIALVVLIAGIIMLSVSKFMNPSQNEPEPQIAGNIPQNNNNLGEDVPNLNVNDNSGIVMNNNEPQGNVPGQQGIGNSVPPQANQQQQSAPQVQHATKPIPATSFLSVRKLSWEVPDYVSSDSNFRQYFQSAGKSLKAALSSDLLLATDYAYSDQIRVSITYSKDGAFQRAKILLSSGSGQIDNIVLQSVNQTLKVLKAPSSLGNDQSTTVILKIYL